MTLRISSAPLAPLHSLLIFVKSAKTLSLLIPPDDPWPHGMPVRLAWIDRKPFSILIQGGPLLKQKRE